MPRLRCAFALVLASTTAHAYVRSRTTSGTPVFWQGASISIVPDAAGSLDLPLPTVLAVIRRAVANWQAKTGPCSYLKINVLDPAPLDSAIDQVSAVKFRRPSRWCRPADGKNPEVCYSPHAAAITTVFYTTAPGKCQDGAIVDADIQLNETQYTFQWLLPCADPGCPTESEIRTDPTSQRIANPADLENTLTHELGHLQGLDHTCWDGATPAPSLDSNGRLVPACHEVGDPARMSAEEEARIIGATMYNFAPPREVSKRSPEADDVAGVCGIYPVASPPVVCAQKGCAVAVGGARRGGGGASGWLVAAALALFVRRRRGR